MPDQMRENTQASRSSKILHEPAFKRRAPLHPLLHIQKSLGNQALLHLRSSLGTIQTKLSLGQPNDVYEQEADTVASRIIHQISKMERTPGQESDANLQAPAVQRQELDEEEMQMRRSEIIQRQVEEEEEEEEMIQSRREDTLQRQEEEEELMMPRRSDEIQRQEEEELAMPSRSDTDQPGSLVAGPIPDDLEHQVEQARQGGNALDGSVRSQMESGFGYDFQQVHIHTDSASDNLSRQLSAEAFTLKNDIFFRNGRYDPSSAQGQDLLAHELTHVVQQGAAQTYAPSVDAESTGGV